MITGLDHVQLAAPEGGEEALRAFYGDLLGLTEIAKPAELRGRGGAWFQGPGFQLHVGVERDFRPALKAHPGLVVADLDALAARLAAAGHEIRYDTPVPGFRRFFSADPVGNRLEFLEKDAPDRNSRTQGGPTY
ncbi:VOC family protein [Actinocorallia longicatena]|uniref:VOC family protein n=1 Tax=Actinocorallia longicatena TaxID=111803 RepID=A0ABP6Q1Z9_9ACTN